MDLNGNVALLRSFIKGKCYEASLRQIKLIPHAALTKAQNGNIGEPYPLDTVTNIVELKGIKRVNRAEHLTCQDQVDSVMPSSIDYALAKDLLDYEEGRVKPQLEGTTSIPTPAARPQKRAPSIATPAAPQLKGATSIPPLDASSAKNSPR